MGITRSLRSYLQRFGLVFAFLLLALTLTLLSDRFLTVSNMVNVLRQSTINGIIAVGMTMVILTAGIDLSVGSILGLTAVVTADLLQRGWPVGLAVGAGLALGAALGLINGLLITRGRIPPFIATLGMMTLARGLALTYTQGRPITGLPDGFRFLGTGFVGPVPMPIVIAALVFVVGYLLLTRTRVGEYIYALGNNETAARFSGIPTRRYITLVYVVSGLLSALAGMILVARLDSAQPIVGQGYEFDAIAAVVVGGTLLTGGVGYLFGTLIGVLIFGVIQTAITFENLNSWWTRVAIGLLLLLFILLQKLFARPGLRSDG